MMNLHPEVLEIAKSFVAIGMPSPQSIRNKGVLLTPTFEGERVCVVAADVVRCSTTILTALAAGAAAVTVTVKGGERGTTASDARRVAELLELPMVFGGELNGRPIEGGVIGNSPREVKAHSISNTLLHFQSTNFGAAFSELTPLVDSFNQSASVAKMFIGSLANIEALAREVEGFRYDRIFIGCGGFYENASFEDEVFGGELLRLLNIDWFKADDEARLMMASALVAPSSQDRMDHLQSNWIGRALAHFGMGGDIAAIISGEGIDPAIYRRMRTIVPRLQFVEGIPVIFPTATRPVQRHSQPDSALVLA